MNPLQPSSEDMGEMEDGMAMHNRWMAITLSSALVATCAAVSEASGADPAAETPRAAATDGLEAKSVPQSGETIRIAGDMNVKVEAIPTNTQEGGKTIEFNMYRCGEVRITTPLPEGYPEPTPPKAIDLKGYPLVRRAQVKGESNPDIGMNVGFWPLFNHIKKRDIAMTSPVEMEYGEKDGGGEEVAPTPEAAAAQHREWTMAFLYRTTDMGTSGIAKDNERVEVVDVAPMTVIAMGFKGMYSRALFDKGVGQLRQEMQGLKDWEVAGEPRALYYNGPEMPNGRKWGEVQIPIKRKEASTPAKDGMVPVKVEPTK